jgi:hypothetical protein
MRRFESGANRRIDFPEAGVYSCFMTARALGLVIPGLALLCAGDSMPRRAAPPEASLFAAFAQETSSHPDAGSLIPLRQVSDPYPVFNGIAVDPENNLVAMSDVNRKSLLSYAPNKQSAGVVTPPLRRWPA